MAQPPCSGIIVFDHDKTILVKTYKGSYSFPKGNREKGETSIENAWRELHEETGVTKEYVVLLEGEYIDEYSDKDNLSIRYYIGKLVKYFDQFEFDHDELESVQWITIHIALGLDGLSKKRKDILVEAYEKYLTK